MRDSKGLRWVAARLPYITTLTIVVLVVAIIIAFLILIPLSGKVAEQARAGQRARMTQCDREPVISKVGVAAYAVRKHLPKRSRITRAELRQFEANAPKNCPR